MLDLVRLAALSLLLVGLTASANASDSEADKAATTETAAAETSEAEAGASEESEADKPNPLTVDPDLALWTAGVFFLMLSTLSYFAWNPILDALKAREQGIADDLAAAAAKHEEAKRVLTEHEARLAEASRQVRAMLEEARRDAEATKTQIVAEATAAAKAERERGVRDIAQARDAAVKLMAEQSASLALDLASRVVRQDITADRQNEIVREALGRFASGQTSNN